MEIYCWICALKNIKSYEFRDVVTGVVKVNDLLRPHCPGSLCHGLFDEKVVSAVADSPG